MTRMFSILGSAFLLATLMLAGCATPVQEEGETPESAMSKPILRVGLTPNYPPVVDRVDGELAGIEIDLGTEVARGLGKRLQFVELPFEELIPALANGDIDVIMSGMSITAARKEKIGFTEPYLHVGQMAVTRFPRLLIQKLNNS